MYAACQARMDSLGPTHFDSDTLPGSPKRHCGLRLQNTCLSVFAPEQTFGNSATPHGHAESRVLTAGGWVLNKCWKGAHMQMR